MDSTVEKAITNCYKTQKDTAHALITLSEVEFKRHQKKSIIIRDMIMFSDGCQEVLYKDILFGSNISTIKRKITRMGIWLIGKK